VTPINKALSDSNCKLNFNIMRNSAFSSIATGQDSNTIEVEAVMLDSLEDMFDNIKLIKVDIEGAEMKFLKGAENILKRFEPILIMEVQDWSLNKFGSSSKELISFLKSLNYQVYTLDEKQIEDYNFPGYNNLLFKIND
jgi:hypothetical protein